MEERSTNRFRSIRINQSTAARNSNAVRNQVDFKKIHDRDHGVCQLCGGQVDLKVKRGPQMASFDHIVPLSKGGMHDESNVRLTHWICNTRRRTKVAEGDLRAILRNQAHGRRRGQTPIWGSATMIAAGRVDRMMQKHFHPKGAKTKPCSRECGREAVMGKSWCQECTKEQHHISNLKRYWENPELARVETRIRKLKRLQKDPDLYKKQAAARYARDPDWKKKWLARRKEILGDGYITERQSRKMRDAFGEK